MPCIRATASVLLTVSAVSVAPSAAALDLAWLVGHWCSAAGEQTSEELWLAERGGLMLGLNRSLGSDGTAFEFLRIEIGSMGADYVAQPGGAPPTRFRLVEAAARSVTFENPAHDYPKRIRYRRDAEQLFAAVDAGAADPRPLESRWTRCDAHGEQGPP